MMNATINWKDLVIGADYTVITTGFGGNNIPRQVRIEAIQLLPNNEAMIYMVDGGGFAVGGIFEEKYGPCHRFKKTITAVAAAA